MDQGAAKPAAAKIVPLGIAPVRIRSPGRPEMRCRLGELARELSRGPYLVEALLVTRA